MLAIPTHGPRYIPPGPRQCELDEPNRGGPDVTTSDGMHARLRPADDCAKAA